MKKKQLQIIGFGLFLCLALSSCQSKEAGPKTYDVTGDSAPSINQLLDGEGGVFRSSEAPAEGEEQEAAYVYRYAELPQGGQTVGAYADALTAGDVGFSIVNGAGKQTKAPDFGASEGSLQLSRPNLDLRKNLHLTLAWDENELTVTVLLSEGSQTKDGPAAEGSLGGAEEEAMTAEDAVAFLQSLSPAQLGLPGESMRDYRVYYADGKAMVDGAACLRLRVYQISAPEGSNAILATYFLSPDKVNLYRLNPETHQTEALSLS